MILLQLGNLIAGKLSFWIAAPLLPTLWLEIGRQVAASVAIAPVTDSEMLRSSMR
jgi:hypothetical protein